MMRALRSVIVRGSTLAALLGAVGCGNGEVGNRAGTEPELHADSAQSIVSRHLRIGLTSPDRHTGIVWPPHYDEIALARDNTPAWNPTTDEGATLGRVLFYDTELSFNRTTSCATCHLQELGFTDDEALSTGAEGGRTAAHSMRLANANFYFGRDTFWDRRTANLEEQIVQPILDGIEMGFTPDRGGIEAVLTRMRRLEYYPVLFEWAFGTPEITRDRIERAVAQFIRSMVSIDSEFDRAYAAELSRAGPEGEIVDLNDLSNEENLGFQLFTRTGDEGGAGCALCHLLPNFVLDSNSGNNGLDAGEIRVFKSPSLKNVAVTGPYMHDGRFETLEEVLEHYSSGIISNQAVDRRLLTGEAGGLERPLSGLQQRAIVAFLNTLTDETLLSDPKFSDPFIH